MKLPKAKTENIVVQDLGKELLIYNLTTHKAYTLNETSKIVFESCDGAITFDELKRQHKFTNDLIYLALDELNKNNLLADYQSDHFGSLSRRQVIHRVGLASMIALPVIAGIIAPSAASAASAPPACTINQPFQPGAIIFFVNTANECRAACSAAGGNQCNFNTANICYCYR